jgi:putative oxidoreductase
MFDRLQPMAPHALGILRIVTALLFIAHGTQKLFGFPASDFSPAAGSLIWFAAVIEIVAGALVLVGFQTRIAAFVASGQMAFAYWMAHAPQSPFPVLNGGDASILFCFVFLYLVFAGAGAFSLDGRVGPANLDRARTRP